MQSVCRVAVSAANYAFDRLYDYDIPEELRGKVQPGVRVIVPFGKGSRTCEAIVVRMGCDPKAEYARKSICRVLDAEPVMDAHLLRLAAHLCSTLFCTFYDCARAMLPAGLWFRRVERYTLAEEIPEAQRAQLAQEYPALSVFTRRKRTATAKEIAKKCSELPAEQLDALCTRGVLTWCWRPRRTFCPCLPMRACPRSGFPCSAALWTRPRLLTRGIFRWRLWARWGIRTTPDGSLFYGTSAPCTPW